MRIRVRYKDIEIEVSEEGALDNYNQVTMRDVHQVERVQSVIRTMTEQVIKLKDGGDQ